MCSSGDSSGFGLPGCKSPLVFLSSLPACAWEMHSWCQSFCLHVLRQVPACLHSHAYWYVIHFASCVVCLSHLQVVFSLPCRALWRSLLLLFHQVPVLALLLHPGCVLSLNFPWTLAASRHCLRPRSGMGRWSVTVPW